ncbi:unnamed protein product, partial [Pleuronectes platessa]
MEEDRNWAEMPTSWRRRRRRVEWGASTNHASAPGHSDARRHTSEMNNKAGRNQFGHKDQNENLLTEQRIKEANRDTVRQRPESSTQTEDRANRSEACGETSPPTQSCCTSVPTTIAHRSGGSAPRPRSLAQRDTVRPELVHVKELL